MSPMPSPNLLKWEDEGHRSKKRLDKPTKINGVVFSDLGRASAFLALQWVQQAVQERLGFFPYPATLNVRPKDSGDVRLWESVRSGLSGLSLGSSDGEYCSARLFPVAIERTLNRRAEKVKGAVLLPEVNGYPNDKIEIVAPVRLKDRLGVQDGDQLTLEFLN
jgi:riboflavin kinase